MTSTNVSVPLSMPQNTYPLELLAGAKILVEQAVQGAKERSDDGRGIASLKERANARSAIFTAFNFLESLLIDLAQEHVSSGKAPCVHCGKTINDELANARSEISRTIDAWPLRLIGQCMTAKHEFGPFKKIRQFRNQLVHPKLEPGDNEPSQDELLKACTADKAKEILQQVCAMAKVLYREFNQAVPPEVDRP